MKYVIATIFSIFILMSCQDSTNITDPIIDTTSRTLSKGELNQYELIPLPQKSPAWEDSIFTASKVIDGNVGGVIQMFKYYMTVNEVPLWIYVKLTIPKKAFTGTKTITMTVDNDFAYVHFFPEMIFSKSLLLEQYFQSTDLIQFTGNNSEQLDFVYINDDGEIEMILKNGIEILNPIGLIKVIDAKLPHFSRYGWVRKI